LRKDIKTDRIRYIDCIRLNRMQLIEKWIGPMRFYKNIWNWLKRNLSKILNSKERSILILNFKCSSHIKISFNKSTSKRSKKNSKVSLRKKT
jgi:hypothetical protein